jgi:hypothetical protein
MLPLALQQQPPVPPGAVSTPPLGFPQCFVSCFDSTLSANKLLQAQCAIGNVKCFVSVEEMEYWFSVSSFQT